MKFGNTFISSVKKSHSKYSDRINDFIRKNIWITPLVYAVGTALQLIRNKIYGLQFSAISLGQLFLLTIYMLLMLVSYGYVKYSISSFMTLIKSGKKEKTYESTKYLLIAVLIVLITFYILSLLLINNRESIELTIMLFIFYPIVTSIFKGDEIVSSILTFVMFSIIVMKIPISLGGLCGQSVIYHDYSTADDVEYIYYGNYDNLYQFAKDEKVILIPIESGYIEYKRNNVEKK